MELTEEQKMQFEEAKKSNKNMQLTWQLFTMFLPEYSRYPEIALEIARNAVAVWMVFEEGHIVEYPEMPPSPFQGGVMDLDMGELMGKAAVMMYQKMKEGKDVGLAMETPGVVVEGAPGEGEEHD